jgi:kumamolisin
MKLPWYQEGVITDSKGMRAAVDVALAGSTMPGYWAYYLAKWDRYGGTSIAAPVFAGLLAVVNQHRAAQGSPPVGFLNPFLYRSADVQKAFRDVTEGGTDLHAAKPGWDYPTGFGAPDATVLANTSF